MIAYKLVNCDYYNKKMYSINAISEWRLEYKIGEVTYPKVGKIFLYKSPSNAYKIFNTKLLKCEIPDDSVTAKIRCNSEMQSLYERFWINNICEYKVYIRNNEGVLYADWCLPLEEVSVDYRP